MSGGVDSMALAILIARWQNGIRKMSKCPHVDMPLSPGDRSDQSGAASCQDSSETSPGFLPSVGLVVDHGLRESSGQEAELTWRRLIGLGKAPNSLIT